MTTDHDSDPDATVRMPRPAPSKDDLEQIDPDSTLIREDWGSTTISPPPATTVTPPKAGAAETQAGWETATLRRPTR